MKVSVVVPAYNEEKLLSQTLAAIKNSMSSFATRGWETELVVCDNNSTDRTAEIAREAGARVVFEPINQIGRARNKGAEAAQGDWLIFVDADSCPSAGLFTDVATAIDTGKYVFGGATLSMDAASWTLKGITLLWNSISRLRHWAAGSFIFCNTAVFREIGGFDTTLFAGEELDLSQRLLRTARTRGKKGVILSAHPLVTSARKVHLYKQREMLWLFVRAAITNGRILRSREACFLWYDGRR